MEALEKISKSLIPICIFSLLGVWFFLDRKYSDEPRLKELDKKAFFLTSEALETLAPDLNFLGKRDEVIADIKVPAPPTVGSAFGARNREVRLILAKLNGGGEDTENAVELGLDYLASIQESGGAWENTTNFGKRKRPQGATGLALLAFLGAGYHPLNTEKHQAVTLKGLDWLSGQVKADGALNAGNIYDISIAGTVFAEAYALTGSYIYKELAERIVGYLVRGQGPTGGWGYSAWTSAYGDGSKYATDTSSTGWAVMAFKSALMAGIDVPKENVERYLKFALSVTNNSGEACYSVKSGTKARYTATMGASTMMCRLYMGDTIDSPRMRIGLKRITTGLKKNEKPKWGKVPAAGKTGSIDNYRWYHATQVAFLAKGLPWRMWNAAMKRLLLKHQIKDGAQAGSWDPIRFRWTDRSRVYSDVLNILTLETYYRYYK